MLKSNYFNIRGKNIMAHLNEEPEEGIFNESDIQDIKSIINELTNSLDHPNLDMRYLTALGNVMMSNEVEDLRKLIELDLGENFEKIQKAAHPITLCQLVNYPEAIGILKLCKDAGMNLNFFMNEIDFSVMKSAYSDAELKTLQKLDEVNLYTIAAKSCANFEYALGKADISLLEFLSENGVKPTSPENIYPAILAGNFELFKFMITKGEIDPHSKIKTMFLDDKVTLLQATLYARDENDMGFPIHKGHLDIINYLCDQGLDVEAEHNEEFVSNLTPLKTAAASGYLELAECLIDHRAKVDSKNWDTPLFVAISYRNFDIVKLFVEKGADFLQDIPYEAFPPVSEDKKSMFSIRSLLDEHCEGEKLEKIDKEKQTISLCDLAELKYKDSDSYHNVSSAQICIYLYFLAAVHHLKNDNQKLVSDSITRAIFYQQQLQELKHPSNLLFRLANSLNSDKSEEGIYYLPKEKLDQLNKELACLKQSFTNELKTDLHFDDKKLLQAIVFEDIQAINKYFKEFDKSVDSPKLQDTYFEAIQLATKLESVAVLQELNSIGQERLPNEQKKLLATVLLESLRNESYSPAKTFHEAGINPNFQFNELDFDNSALNDTFDKDNPIRESINTVHYLDMLLHNKENGTPHPALGYLLRKGYTSNPKEDAPEKVSIAGNRNRFQLNNNNEQDGGDNTPRNEM